MSREQVTDEFPKAGDNVPVQNLSGDVKTIGATLRHNERGSDGRWSPRAARLIRPLDEPTGPGWVRETVTGQMMRGEDRSVLMRNPMEFEQIHHVSPDYSRYVEPGRKSNAGLVPAQDALNHVVSCPSCATGGASSGC